MSANLKYPIRLKIFAIAGAAVAMAGCQDSGKRQAQEPRPVLVTAVHYQSQASDRRFVGVIKPRIETDISFRVGGKVASRLVDVGDTVAVGQPLAILEETDLRLQAEQADAEQRAATGALAQAGASEGRANGLRRGGWSTDAQVELARAAGDEARARLARAQRAVELPRNSLSYARLLADAPGVVTAAFVEPGQVVSPGQTAIRVAKAGEREVVVSLPEVFLATARAGEAHVSLWAAPGRQFAAKLREIAPSADPATRTYLAKFSLLESDEDVRIGMTATLTLSDPGGQKVARVPLSALFNQGASPSLYVVNDAGNGVVLKPVLISSYDSADALIKGGVEEGDRVVALGVQKLDARQSIKVVSSLSF